MLEVVENLVDLPLGGLADGYSLEDLGEAHRVQVRGLPLLHIGFSYSRNL